MKRRDEYISMIAEHAERLKRRVKRHRDGAITIWPGVLDRKHGKILEYGQPQVLESKPEIMRAHT